MKKDELCEEGQQLWDVIDPRKTNSYDNYRRHIIQCSRCKFGLDLGRKDVLRIRDDIKEGEKNEMKICPRCNGEGRVKGEKGYSDCIVCKGEGKLFTWELEEYNKREKKRFRGYPSDDCHTYD